MVLSWKDLNIEVKNSNANICTNYIELIQCSSGFVKPGELLAIMGPSGGGKTTLLKMLAGHIPSGSITQGEILYKNEPRDPYSWMKTIGFVDQDDIVFEDLTIEETIRYAGKFRDLNFNEKRLETILLDLGLNGVAKNKMKKISGGQRKRTMIAIELIADPKILFLDEPTSGLDALTAFKLIEMLKKLALEQNKIIIMSIHQPSEQIFQIFDQIMLLAKAKQIYYGETNKIEEYFKEKGFIRPNNVSLPDFIILICDNEYQRDNSTFSDNAQNVFEHIKTIKDKNNANIKNDFVIDYLPNFNHICLLVKRRFSMISHKKYPFFKGQLIKLIIYSYILFSSIYYYDKFTKKSNDFKKIDVSKQKFEKDFFILKTIGMYFTIVQVITSTISIYVDSQIIEREIKIYTYTTGSYYISMILYQAIVELLVPLTLYLPMIFITKIYSIAMTLYFLISPFFGIPFALFFGAITKIRVVQTILGFLFGIIGCIDPVLYVMWINTVKNLPNKFLQNLSLISYGLLFILPVHFKAIIYFIFIQEQDKNIRNKMLADINFNPNNLVQYDNYTELQEFYINGHHTGFSTILLMLIGSYIFLVFGGITWFGLNTMPARRLKLQKNK